MSNLSDTKDLLQFIRCSVGSETYGLDMSKVIGIRHNEHLKYNSNKKGPLGWLDNNTPVIDLTRRLGIARTTKDGGNMQRIIILRGKGGPWALMVGSVSRVISVPLNCVSALPSVTVNSPSSCFAGVIKMGEKMLLLLSPENINAETLPDIREQKKNKSKRNIDKPRSVRERRAGQVVIFSASEQRLKQKGLYLGLSISQVSEILEPLPIVEVPGAPHFVQGIVNWRDRAVPVIDLYACLKLGAEVNELARTRLIIIRNKAEKNEDIYMGFLIKPNVRLLRFPTAAAPYSKNIPANIKLLRTVVELGQEILMIPDVKKIVASLL